MIKQCCIRAVLSNQRAVTVRCAARDGQVCHERRSGVPSQTVRCVAGIYSFLLNCYQNFSSVFIKRDPGFTQNSLPTPLWCSSKISSVSYIRTARKTFGGSSAHTQQERQVYEHTSGQMSSGDFDAGE